MLRMSCNNAVWFGKNESCCIEIMRGIAHKTA
jgi:hypothetical protein